ncbi:hypothetical protein KDRO_E03170 [Kluyveromyces lactis]|nr:hypothetical protein KDRO_E03170 [Kluyveromyces lactis]
MGVAAGTLVFMADGSLKPIEDVTIEEEVLSSDGSANFVQSIISCHERMFEVTQLSLHRAHKKKGVNFAPFDMIRLRCSGSQGLMLSNRMVEGMFQDRRNPEERLLEPSVIPASDTTVDSDDTAVDENDGSVPTSDIVVIDEEPDNSDDSGVYDIELNDEEDPEEDINDFRLTERVKDYGSQAVLDSEQEIHDKMQEGLLRAQTEDLAISDEPPLFRMQKSSDAHNMSWPAEVIRIDKLHEPIRQKARIQLSAVNKQISIMRAQLESLFNKPISDRELGAMAWLLGFWLGDGYRRGSIFALNKEDHDVNSTLKRYGEIWGLSMRMVNCTENLGTTAYLFIKPGKVRLLTTGNPFWNVVKNLEFIVDKKKNFPKKYSYDEPLVRVLNSRFDG